MICVVRLFVEISTVNASFCKVRTTVPHSIWHFRSKNRYAIFQCNEYYLDSLSIVGATPLTSEHGRFMFWSQFMIIQLVLYWAPQWNLLYICFSSHFGTDPCMYCQSITKQNIKAIDFFGFILKLLLKYSTVYFACVASLSM